MGGWRPPKRRHLLGLGWVVGTMLAAGGCEPTPSTLHGPRWDAHGTTAAGRFGAPGASAGTGPAALPGQGSRQPLGKLEPVELAFSLRPVVGGQSVLLVAQDDAPGRSFVRRISASGESSPALELDDRFAVGAFDGPEPALMTSSGRELCWQRFEPDSPAPRCAPSNAVVVAVLPTGLALLEARTEPAQEKAKPKGEHAGGHGEHSQAFERATEPEKIHIWLERRSLLGEAQGEAVDTGLGFLVPMPGMGLIDARGSDGGVELLWYQHEKGIPGKPGATASLRAGWLDASGRFVATTRTTLFQGERQFGTIDGHLEPELLGSGGPVSYLGRFVDPTHHKPGGCETRSVRPSGGSIMVASAAICAIDPGLLLGRTPVSSAELSLLEAVRHASPELGAGQPRTDAAQIAWAGPRGYALCQGKLCSFEHATGQQRAEPAPFVAQRSRLHWTAFSPAGRGIARTGTSYALVAEDGSAHELAIPAGAKVPSSPRGWGGFRLPAPVLIGETWWALRPTKGHGTSGWALVELAPRELDAPPLPVAVHPDSAVLVGGASRGLLLVRRGTAAGKAQLLVYGIATDGRAALLAGAPAALDIGFAAVERAAGGAIVAGSGPAEPRRALVLALDANGQARGLEASSIDRGPGLGALRLVSLPRGGALLFGAGEERVAWLDDDGREQAIRPLPAARASASCLDGEPARPWVPGPTPGLLVQAAELARGGTCVVGEPHWALDGSLRWFGTSAAGMDSQAELGMVSAAALGLAAAPGMERAPIAPGPSASAHPPGAPGASPPAHPPSAPSERDALAPCPPDMVFAAGKLCVDRFEARLGEGSTGLALSADYPATPGLAEASLTSWVTGKWRVGDLHAKAMPLPPLLRARGAPTDPVARSGRWLRPSGYLTGLVAEQACAAAGKRLCTPEEFVTACRGEEDRKFPYGDSFEPGACNVFRDSHPAAVLHGNASVGHLDPRLDRVVADGGPLLRATGATPRCRSHWGEDYIYDMVGNLDEWVQDEHGAFAGGFYSRSTRAGCDALITAHPRKYLDYSTGTRCCLEARPTP
jgi:hypothetical protein